MYFGFPYDYHTEFYINKSVGGFGGLISWYNPRQDRRYVMVHVQLIHMRLIPKSFVVRQLGGACDCWTVQVTILRSNDWNAHLPEVPPAGEEPPPPNGDPHPLFGPEMTAEQLYQQQVHN